MVRLMGNVGAQTTKFTQLADDIKRWGRELGFQAIGVTDVDLSEAETRLLNWLDAGHHGELAYMAKHGARRSRPQDLLPGTVRVISTRMDYFPGHAVDAGAILENPNLAFISRYALGRDYHKVLRKQLKKLAARIERAVGEHHYRVFTDSAPVLEKPLAEKAGLGWIGKHTNLLNRTGGSWFFLGEIYTDLPLPVDRPAQNHCGRCQACIDVCPTGAIIAPYELDARLCISYLTIELRGAIPVPLRPLIGNRIFGCDDCQMVCPWNRFAKPTNEPDFAPRREFDAPELVRLFSWSETEFLERTKGSAIRRIGYEGWLRNIAVALGNAPTSSAVIGALKARLNEPSALVREHVRWALAHHDAAVPCEA